MTFQVTGLPSEIELIEGESQSISLAITGSTGSYQVSYYFTTAGGTASASDYSGGSGSYAYSAISNVVSTRHIDFSVSAAEDTLPEGEETLYLVVQLSGDARFSDGSQYAKVEVTLMDIPQVYGTGKSDEIIGEDFKEEIYGKAGSDSIAGGAGDDTINGGIGADTIDGGSGNDIIVGKDGFDVIHGGSNNDTIEGNAGPDQLFGGGGNDSLEGGQGADTIDGGAGARHDRGHGR